MKNFVQIINEGFYDPGIFKAFFLAGGPGSGKTFVTNQAFAGSGLKVVNSDIVFEKALKSANLSLSMPDEEAYFRDIVRKSSKTTTGNQLDSYVKGRLGLVIDATGRDYNLIHTQSSMLKLLGYDCSMVFVNTSLEVALERQKKRERQVPEYIAKKSWESVQSNMGRFQNLFGLSNFVLVDNNKSDQELVTLTLNKVSKVVRRLINTPIKSYVAKRWMAKERAARRR
jgi:predicted kinase|tara:strand:+ start:492 stop:1172 length:681 start_codon:yes stop_codon:yes gene_type:complete